MRFSNSTLFVGALGLIIGLIISRFSGELLQYLPESSFSKHTETYIKNTPITEQLASSMWCSYRLDGSKYCKFRNLYFIPKFKGHLLFILNEFSVVSGVDDLKKLSLSTVINHKGVFLKLILTKSVEFLMDENISFVQSNIFIVQRFKPDNIMHVIHDDLIPLFVTFKELCSGDFLLCLSTYQLLLLDTYNSGPYFEWYGQFTAQKPIIFNNLKIPTCFEKGYFGLSNASIWFQYGFKTTQGPVLNSGITSFLLEEFSQLIKKQFGILPKESNSTKLDKPLILFFSRKINRKIINEDFMQEKMLNISQFILKQNCTIVNMDLSASNSSTLVHLLQQSQLLVGMHGSAMILAMFMPPGSHIIELFPFGIEPEFVSPLRALCINKYVYYHYESWVNMKELNTRTHPEYPPLLGGTQHLEEVERQLVTNVKNVPPVECCHNPVYLFRMFQDTVVDNSFFTLFERVVINYSHFSLTEHQMTLKKKELEMNKWYFPPPVFNLSCSCHSGILKIIWDYPFMCEGIEFSIATSNGILHLSKFTNFNLRMEYCNTSKDNNGKEKYISVWVKAVENDKESLDSFEHCISTVDDSNSEQKEQHENKKRLT